MLRRFYILALLAVTALPAAAEDGAWPLGDTLTTIMRPILSVPTILAAGETLDVIARAPAETGEWNLSLFHEPRSFPLEVIDSVWEGRFGIWRLRAPVPAGTPEELYDLRLTASGGIVDTTIHAVKVLEEFPDEWYFAHITDTHLLGHIFSQIPGWEKDTSEVGDFRAVVEDLNILAPEFLIITGDFINEGELEDFENYRAYSRSKRLLHGLDMPVYLIAGNHDIGGWVMTPPPDGTARKNWWRFFGWPWLDDPPDGVFTQNYFFDFGKVRFIGLESYDNYDSWRFEIYTRYSFRNNQLNYMHQAINEAPFGSSAVVFYHYDFSNQITNPAAWGIDLILYGHIHRNDGSISDPVPNLATESVCDGNRAFRIVRVRDGNQLAPRETIYAGRSEDNLTLRFETTNDGTEQENMAKIVNGHNQQLEFAEARFVMSKDVESYAVEGGEIVRTFDADTALVVVARASVAAKGAVDIRIAPGSSDPAPSPPPSERLALLGNVPNPFNGSTEIRFEIPEDGEVEIRLHDIKGRYLFPIAHGLFPAGENSVFWDGHAPSGVRVPSGVYLYQLLFGNETITGRVTYVR